MKEVPVHPVFGDIHVLSKKITHYKYCVLQGYEMMWRNRYRITIPKGFLADGSSGGPDIIGNKHVVMAWLCHDWLYRHHYYYDEIKQQKVMIDRHEADAIMYHCLLDSGHWWYAQMFYIVFKFNILCQPSTAWEKSVIEGPEFMQEHDYHDDYSIVFEDEYSY
jgi:hypothetical protein